MFVPIILLGAYCVILLVGIILFKFIFKKYKEDLYLATLLFGFFAFMLIACQIVVILATLEKNYTIGRQFHRLQALSSFFFAFNIPHLIYTRIDLNRGRQCINRIIARSAMAIPMTSVQKQLFVPDGC